MALAALCAVMAALRVVPNRSQFFQYESVSLVCGQWSDVSEWRVWRNTSTSVNEACFWSRDGGDAATCLITDPYPSDSGAYWCQSGAGQRSRSVSIIVTAGAVILDLPALPVLEGEAVTLHCSHRTGSSSTSSFYKDGVLVASGAAGTLSLSVSQADRGLYSCSVSGAGASPSSWLEVRGAGRPDPAGSTLALILLPVALKCFSLIALMLSCLWRKRRGLTRFLQLHSQNQHHMLDSRRRPAGPVRRTHTYTSGPEPSVKRCR
ncbi:uncharacterized protein LOC114869108 isoform X2 [Betta splendens]|uniref:Uncharacterized protein LOC114869108 isoform X2 n=1 Tax=Betta splendens TaxID=158456 RepID=A0A9W2Y7G7_BETSP|nr:uncharacterized protein LOC114869108 isoform X2 [Betta splendens]